ncbi:type VI secretion system Vgr family protein [Klebsiella sp. BIGb0407]|uniref:type VI secretion system Vgr family protein n=1 Tax=Klebsiella sp. BIGb0407 TaxID=2940603 RepID=UPI0021694DD1|nr:type VI secretion system Vgr family protein [Klebsiella sp. BIGb0407]MCS3433645.1 type VI secretion system secreted protein VgrG [Klebsiella sp. BIGb0407]
MSLNRYRLDIPSCSSRLDVEDFSGAEGMSQMYHYDILFTSNDKDIDVSALLSKPATLTMGTGLLGQLTGQKVVSGVITDFRRLSGSIDEAKYLITLRPFLALLDNQFRSHRFFVNKSVPEVVTQVLNDHRLRDWEFEFILKQAYPKREQINQYQESDLAFIERLLAEVGIFYFFTLQPDTRTEVIHFADKQSAWQFGKTLPLSSPSGMSDSGADSVWDIHVRHNVVASSVTARDYNHREAQKILTSAPADMTRGDGEGMTFGEVYHYRPRYQECGDKIYPTAETGNFWARLEHERLLSTQTVVTGSSSDAHISPAQVLTITESAIPPALPAATENGLIIISTRYTASRKNALRVVWTAMPYSETRCWRPPAKKRPVIGGTLTARITSAKAHDTYAWQDVSGLYRVQFDADRDAKNQGLESMPVRLAKPYGGDKYGFHFPLIQGTEVAIAFHEGDPDRPYIAHVLHDSRHVDHVTEKNSTRNVIRTAGLNKLRMEDKRGEEHIKLSTEYGGKTQLSLGHNVDASRALRGKGAELRTDDRVSIRGGKGVFISADIQPLAQGQMLAMDEAIRQLEQALTLARSMAKAAVSAKAIDSDICSQKQLNVALSHLEEPGILLHAPEGIGMVSAGAIGIASGSESVSLVSGANTDISAGQAFTVAASAAVSLLANSQGMKLLAAKGRVNIQAQSDALAVNAQKDLDIQSTEGKVTVTAQQALLLACGGSYIKLSGGNIELGCPGNILLKCNNLQKMGAARIDIDPVDMPVGFGGGFIFTDDSGVPQASMPYQITTREGEIFQGVTDNHGKTAPVYTDAPASVNVEFGGSNQDRTAETGQGAPK